MGSFRSPAARAADQALLTAADRPAALPEFDDTGRPNWLMVDEAIRYWTRLPHGAEARVAGAATITEVDARGRMMSARFDVGAAAVARVREGIVAFENVVDEAGFPVRWDRANADALIDGLPPAVVRALGDAIDGDRPPRLGDATREGTTEGEAPAAS